jgi:transposase
LTKAGQRWLGGLPLSLSARAQVDVYLRLLAALEAEKRQLEAELRDFARSDRRCQALETIYGVGPIIACHLLAELGDLPPLPPRPTADPPRRPRPGRLGVRGDPPSRPTC